MSSTPAKLRGFWRLFKRRVWYTSFKCHYQKKLSRIRNDGLVSKYVCHSCPIIDPFRLLVWLKMKQKEKKAILQLEASTVHSEYKSKIYTGLTARPQRDYSELLLQIRRRWYLSGSFHPLHFLAVLCCYKKTWHTIGTHFYLFLGRFILCAMCI